MATSDLLSNAAETTTVDGNSIIPVASAAGQPTRNVKLSTLASVVGGLIGTATTTKNGLASMNMCIAYVGEGPVVKISSDTRKRYLYTFLIVLVYENGLFKKVELAMYSPNIKGRNLCSKVGPGSLYVKEDTDCNVYIYNNSLDNATYCVSIIGTTKRIDMPSVNIAEVESSVLDSLTLTDVGSM